MPLNTHQLSRSQSETLPNRHAGNEDEGLADLQSDLDIANDARELVDIAEALERMERAEYGTCIDCGRHIAWARLQAQPHAKRCIHCEEARERATAQAVPGL